MAIFAQDGASVADPLAHFPPLAAPTHPGVDSSRDLAQGAFDWTVTPDAAPVDLDHMTYMWMTFTISIGLGLLDDTDISATLSVDFNGTTVLNALPGTSRVHCPTGNFLLFISAEIVEWYGAISLSGDLNSIRYHGAWNWAGVGNGELYVSLHFMRSEE